jgi:arylsulfatase A-like enzyme
VKDGEVRFETAYITDVITDNALEMLDDLCAEERPFYLSVHYTAPHSPWGEKNHQKEYLDKYPHPWSVDTAPKGTGEKRKELLRGYFAAVTAMDHNIEKLIQKLEDHNALDNTLIIFTSDNGMNMGHHGIWGKGNGTFPQNMYDSSVKVPFIISYGQKILPGVCENLTSHCDIFPTLMDWLDIEYETKQQQTGRSFAGVLQGNPEASRDFVVVHDEYGPVRMIRNKEWKYVHRYPYGPHELYNLEKDPGEEDNLENQPDYTAVKEALKHALDCFYTEHADIRMDGTREAVTGLGQLRRCGVYAEGKQVYSK